MLERDIMGGLAKGLSVIEGFSADRPRQSISDIAATSGLDRATARRCLLTLAHLGYADYDGKYFTLTPRILRLGTACLATMPLPQMVQPMLDGLSDRMGQSSSVSILDGSEIVYVARAAQRKVMSIALMPGSRLPAFCTSMGRVMLANLAEAEARMVLEAVPLVARTEFTVTDVERLMAILATVRNQGFAVIDQEIELGLRSIAVPLYNSRNKVVAALNIGLPASQAEIGDLERLYLAPMLAAQAELRAMLN
jgi:IclR family pca regulon transcriptional regulator